MTNDRPDEAILNSNSNDRTQMSVGKDYEVSSEIYDEKEFSKNVQIEKHNKSVVSKFPFVKPITNTSKVLDKDGDLVITRKQDNIDVIQIEHSRSTTLQLVGLQVWRGALLLADLVLHLGSTGKLDGATVLELGSGVGLSTIVAAMFAEHVICTDIDNAEILDLIKRNIAINSKLVKSKITIAPLNFFDKNFSEQLTALLNKVTVILASDVIYDNDLTDAFVELCKRLLAVRPGKTIYIALEKRYVFTVDDMETVAPCYEHFLTQIKHAIENGPGRMWNLRFCPIDFPQRFQYNRVKHLVLWSLSSE